MQIHEVTKQSSDQVTEGLASTLGNIAGKVSAKLGDIGDKITGGGEFKAAMNDPKRQQQIKMLSDKAYLSWKAYEKTLLQANPDAKETPMYEQALLAFVTKNLLGGQYLPNVINKAQIQSLVKQLSGTGSIKEADEVIGATRAGAPTSAERAKLQQMIADKSTAQAKASAPQSSATTPQTPKPVATVALSPQQEKDLWFKLTQQAAVAQAQAPGMGSPSRATPDPDTDTQPDANDAKTYEQQLTQLIDKAVVNGLPVFGTTAMKNVGSNTVKSTGNPVADALLLMAGFQGI